MYQNFQSSIPTVTNSVTPTIIEERQLNVAAMSVFDRLMMELKIRFDNHQNIFDLGIIFFARCIFKIINIYK